ncbi:DUF2510 domain-containing protein [Humidisolicoccus flavus]|uniref:DUF2510 domain-containing protein n=1 Tax=Humidisolicoccus flavus TaxID=3111414 RepID=UPI003252A612
MSMPAGWHDDGSGRQRWWDGQRWTEHVAPAQGGSAAWMAPPPATTARVSPVLGFIGLGLAGLGTIVACIPATFLIGVIVLIAGLVLSLVGLFTKNAAKWPSIAGIVLSLVGGAIGTVIVLFAAVLNLAGSIEPVLPVVTPTSSETAQPSAPVVPEPSGARPSPEEIAVGLQQLAQEGGVTSYDDQPEFFACMGQFFYDSELSDEALQTAANGEDVLGAERELAIEVATEAALSCDP